MIVKDDVELEFSLNFKLMDLSMWLLQPQNQRVLVVANQDI